MTYSIVARDPETGQLGVGSQSHYFALGRLVTFARAGVGAVATQSFVDPSYGHDGLDLMSSGKSAAETLTTLLGADADKEIRQVGMIDAGGNTACFTGERCVPFRGEAYARNVAVLGNMLASADVIPAMMAAYEAAEGDLASKILAALDAGEVAGGDARGRMSASLVIVGGERGSRAWSNRLVDLRVDESQRPLVELRRLVALNEAHRMFGDSVFTPGLLSLTAPTSGADLDSALAALDKAQGVIGPDPEPIFWKGVLLMRAGKRVEGTALVGEAIKGRGQYRSFVDGLHAVGILPVGSSDLVDDA